MMMMHLRFVEWIGRRWIGIRQVGGTSVPAAPSLMGHARLRAVSVPLWRFRQSALLRPQARRVSGRIMDPGAL